MSGGSYTPTGMSYSDMLFNKPVLHNPNGSISTERTMTVEVDGKSYVIPTIVGGVQLTPDQAFAMFTAGMNKPVGVFPSESEASAYARDRTRTLGKVYRP